MAALSLAFGLGALVALTAATAVAGGPPAQRLPSALLVFPYLDSNGGETRIELVNLTAQPQELNCFYVSDCNEVGFFVFMTPYQPMGWVVTAGLNDTTSGTAVPPFFGVGELKCTVVAPRPDLNAYNTIQGRATFFAPGGRSVSYSAVAFQRLSPGEYDGVLALNGTTYAQCPDKLHFDVLTDTPAVQSDLILVPCSQNLLTQEPTTITVQFQIINEFEQSFSASQSITCFNRRTLSEVAGSLTRATAATDTAHLVVRGVTGPVLGLVIDGVSSPVGVRTAGNEPSLQGGRSATVVFP